MLFVYAEALQTVTEGPKLLRRRHEITIWLCKRRRAPIRVASTLDHNFELQEETK